MQSIKNYFSGIFGAAAPAEPEGKVWTMSEKNFSTEGPIPVELTSDKWICRCGHSQKYPYCDGSHKEVNKVNGTEFSPLKVEAKEGETVWVCRCGYSKNTDGPFCDGSHNKLKAVASKQDSVGVTVGYALVIAAFAAFAINAGRKIAAH
eukprot:gene6720-7813_t